jgi:2-polyprenyl-3-methyl-5-hydroxy-6-metoxy-1,4-benzoquinol methylase
MKFQSSVEQHYNLALNEILKMKSNLRLLEIGAGYQSIRKYLPPNIKYDSMDYAEEFYEIKPTYNFNLNEGKFPIPDNTYDLIICNDVLEHVLYPKKVLKEIIRITKNDAVLFFSLPNEYNFVMRLYYLFAKKTKVDEPFVMVEKGLHIHKPRVKDIVRFFSNDFRIEKVDYVWQSRKSESLKFIKIADKMINLFAKIYPSMFARVVALKVTKK